MTASTVFVRAMCALARSDAPLLCAEVARQIGSTRAAVAVAMTMARKAGVAEVAGVICDAQTRGNAYRWIATERGRKTYGP